MVLVLQGSEPDANERGGRLFVSVPPATSFFCKALGRLRLAGIHPAEGRRARGAAPGVYLCHPVHNSNVGSWADTSNAWQRGPALVMRGRSARSGPPPPGS